jgi:hypothetical protein
VALAGSGYAGLKGSVPPTGLFGFKLASLFMVLQAGLFIFRHEMPCCWAKCASVWRFLKEAGDL